MPRRCAFGCPSKGNSLHRFPLAKKFPELLKAWVSLVGGKLETAFDYEFYKKKMVCDRHFTNADRNRHNRLNALAIPTLHLQDYPELKKRLAAHNDHNYSKDEAADKILHTFPHPFKDKDRFNAWIFAIGGKIIGLDNDFIFKQRRVCHSHFEEKFHCRNKRISNNALPTLYLQDLDDPLQKSSRKEQSYYTDQSKKKGSDENTLGSIAPKPTSEAQFKPTDGNEDNLEDPTAADLSDDPDPVQFSWQNGDQISLVEDDDSIFFGDGPSTMEMVVESTEDGVTNKNEIKKEKHTEYFCDSCSKEIIGFRYTCVQCENFDLCCACEGDLRHPHHYMLRVPKQKPFSEVNSILEAVREKIKLLTEEAQNISTGLELEEIKLEEPEFEEVTVDPFSEVTTALGDHTSGLPVRTPDKKTTHYKKASDTHTRKSKAPVKIVMPTDVFYKAFNINPSVVLTSENITTSVDLKSNTTNHTPTTIKRPGTSRILPTTRTQTILVPAPASQTISKPLLEVIDLEHKDFACKRTKGLRGNADEDLRSEFVTSIPLSKTQEEEDEIWLEDETETPRNQKPTSVVETMEKQCQEYIDEIWLDDTVLQLEYPQNQEPS